MPPRFRTMTMKASSPERSWLCLKPRHLVSFVSTVPQCLLELLRLFVTSWNVTLPTFSINTPATTVRGDFNCVIDPALDQHGVSDPHRWPWLSGEFTYVPARLVDTFRYHHPSAQEYTRYQCARWNSESRLDYIFASTTTVAKFPVLDASILSDYPYSNHHPVSATFKCPAPLLLAKPPPTPFVYRNLNEEEGSTYTSRLFTPVD